jgi:two-component system, OmpR family, sensor histidine kinase KdpD
MSLRRAGTYALGRMNTWRRRLCAAAASLGAVGVVTGAIYALKPVAPVLSLGVLYLFAVLPVAAVWGLPFATAVSVVSMLAFNWFFLPPRHTLRLRESENWVALAVYLVTAVSVSGLAALARRRAGEAEQQQREAAFAAEVSGLLLERPEVQPQLREIARRAAALFGAAQVSIELGSMRKPDSGERTYDLEAGGRHLGRLFVDAAGHAEAAVAERLAPVLASLLATAIEREDLARSARESEARRQAEAIEAEALRRSDAVKTALLRSVSHDLRSPLTAIGTASEVLASPGEPLADDEREELLASIRLQVRRLDRLVSNLLDLSRLEADAAKPVLELWTVDGLVGRALEALGAAGERVAASLPEESPPVRVDAAQIERALVNLLENALRYSSPPDPVEIRAEVAVGEVVIRVVDRGPGIPEPERETIFEPFRQGTEGADRGTGLGLAIARGFALVNNGRLWVDSDPGAGASFALALPAVKVPSRVRA